MEARFSDDRNALYQRLLPAILRALVVGFFYLTARYVVSWKLALALAAWLAVGLLLSSTSRSVWSDTYALPLNFGGMYILVRSVFARRPFRHWTILLGIVLSLAFMMKPPNAVPSAMIGLLAMLAPEVSVRLKLSFVVTCVLCAFLFGASSFLIYGEIVPPYFAPSRVEQFELSRLLGVLFSPGRGLLWFMPSAFLAAITPILVWRDRRVLVVSLVALIALVLSVLAIGNFEYWWGGWSYGPRLLQFALPSVALLALIAIRQVRLWSMRRAALVFSILAAVAGWEGVVHISGTLSPKAAAWNKLPMNVNNAQYRLWDWSDPQFLAAFRPEY